MVENGKDYVLQWTGHAAHVTERFSGLLARQALVDVTLICQGQKLRVHKLVLASSSLYFEEMLEQDLGQEPIILLRDLDFEVLKAMIEFMYCGETTISSFHLQTLLDAAEVFKVKELKCIVESMIKSKLTTNKISSDLEDSSSVMDTQDIKKINCKARPSGERCDEKSLPSDLEETEILENKTDRIFDNNLRINYNDEENSYEITEKMEEQSTYKNEEEESLDEVSLDNSESEMSKMSMSEDDGADEEDEEESMENNEILNYTKDNPLKSFYNETRCCKFIDETELRENAFNENSSTNCTGIHDLSRTVGECSRVYTHKKRKFIDNDESIEETIESSEKMAKIDETVEKESEKTNEYDKTLEKCLKVYTHKRRKSIDERRCQIFDNVCDSIEEPSSTSNIDLNDDKSLNDTPINLSSSLDMETSEYIWSLSTETIQYVVGCTINSDNSLIKNNEMKNNSPNDTVENNFDNVSACKPKRSRQIEEIFTCENDNSVICETPILRRSVRINQLENDDSLNNNNGTINVTKGPEKSLDPETNDYSSDVTMSITKNRRRVNKDPNYRITNENIETPSSLVKTVNSRSLRSRTKLSKNSDISRKVIASRDERTKNNRQNRDKMDKMDSSDILVNTRLNTIASVDRALWGDMADIIENRDDSNEELLNYSSSREIPFAVGLLPLRAALERMQATIDHQPRKTRSSVAPWRQDAAGQRRKLIINDGDNSANVRKQINMENENIERAVCHIEIRTSSSPNDIQNHQISTDEQIITVGPNIESNEQ